MMNIMTVTLNIMTVMMIMITMMMNMITVMMTYDYEYDAYSPIPGCRLWVMTLARP